MTLCPAIIGGNIRLWNARPFDFRRSRVTIAISHLVVIFGDLGSFRFGLNDRPDYAVSGSDSAGLNRCLLDDDRSSFGRFRLWTFFSDIYVSRSRIVSFSSTEVNALDSSVRGKCV